MRNKIKKTINKWGRRKRVKYNAKLIQRTPNLKVSYLYIMLSYTSAEEAVTEEYLLKTPVEKSLKTNTSHSPFQ